MPAWRDPVERFLEKFTVNPETGCWEWTASLGTTGYGQFRVDEARKATKAHRYAYALWVGDPSGLEVCHHCDNRPCVNPDHLFLGTHAENMADMGAKGRHFTPWTEPRPIKLTSEHVAAIRQEYVRGSRTHGTVALGHRYGVSYTMVHNIVTGKAWRCDIAAACKAEVANAYRSSRTTAVPA